MTCSTNSSTHWSDGQFAASRTSVIMDQNRSGQRCSLRFDLFQHLLVLLRVPGQFTQFCVELGQLAQALKYVRRLIHKGDNTQQSCQELRCFCKQPSSSHLSSKHKLCATFMFNG